MVHALRHMAIRLWLSILIGSLATLAILQALQMPLGIEWPFALAVPVFTTVFFGLGRLFNRLGQNLVQNFINEASIWERAGKRSQAEKLFRKAVAVFDSFLISPFHKEKRARDLTGHMARFFLTQTDMGPEAEETVLTYLKLCPEDTAVAEAWLQHLEGRDWDSKEIEDLLSSLGNAQRNTPAIQLLIARLYLAAGRTDFQALQTYQRIMNHNEIRDERLILRMAELFFEKRRMEPWAIGAYIRAYKLDRKRRHLIHAIAACLHAPQADGIDSNTIEDARSLLSKIDSPTLEKMAAEFRPAAPPSKKPETPPKTGMLKRVANAALWAARTSTTGMASAVTSVTGRITATYRRIRGYPKLKPILRWTAVGLAVGGLAILVVNTAIYLVSTGPETDTIEIPPAVVVTDPYTLQVAAYLKIEQAEKYVAQLREMGLDAYWAEAQGAKSKWYQVRLSHFADKASARAYGDTLKARGVIDDFYVANYQRPQTQF